MIYEHDCYREILSAQIKERLFRNPAYSANSFAKNIGISQSFLSLLLNKKRSLSQKAAVQVASKLGFSELETRYFLLLVQMDSCTSQELKEFYSKKIDELKKKNRVHYLDIEMFHAISDWYHSALLELVTLKTIEHSVESYSLKLNISVATVEDALERLQKVGLLEFREGRYYRSNNGFISTPHEIKSKGLRKFHKQVLNMAIDAIEDQELEVRNYSGITVAIDPNQIPEAKKKIQGFMEELMEFLQKGERSEVYQLSTQLFRLEETLQVENLS